MGYGFVIFINSRSFIFFFSLKFYEESLRLFRFLVIDRGLNPLQLYTLLINYISSYIMCFIIILLNKFHVSTHKTSPTFPTTTPTPSFLHSFGMFSSSMMICRFWQSSVKENIIRYVVEGLTLCRGYYLNQL